MSGFWDAVGRAVLGKPGTATPRPRSMFEPDGSAAPFDDIETLNEEDAPATPPVTAEAPLALSYASASVRAPEQPAHGEARAVQPDDRIDDRRAPAPDEAPDPVTHVAPQVATSEEWRQPQELPTVHTLERIEPQRIETTHVLTNWTSEAESDEEPTSAGADPALHPEISDATDTVEHEAIDEADANQPFRVEAEPHTIATEAPAPQPVAQEPPLIIEIERIDIRIESERPATPPPPRRAARGTVPSLDDYLARRSEAGR